MTLIEFEPVFREFTAAFGKDNSFERTKVFYESLQHYSVEEVVGVMNTSIEHDEYFPTVSLLITRIKSHRKLKVLECEYCQGSGWEFVYSEFQYAPGKDRAIRKGAFVTREQYEAEPLKYHQFAARCRCRP